MYHLTERNVVSLSPSNSIDPQSLSYTVSGFPQIGSTIRQFVSTGLSLFHTLRFDLCPVNTSPSGSRSITISLYGQTSIREQYK